MSRKYWYILLLAFLVAVVGYVFAAGDILSEGFETDPGYDDPDWVEDVGGSNIVDEDNADIARPAGGGNLILKIQYIDPGGCLTTNTFGSAQAITYIEFYVQVTAEGLGDGEGEYIIHATSNVPATAWMLKLQQEAGPVYLWRLRWWYDGGYNVDDFPGVSLNTWYKIGIKYDCTNDAGEWLVDDVSQGTPTWTTDRGNIVDIAIGIEEAITVTAYFDLINIDTSAFPTNGEVFIPKVIWIK